MRRLLILAALLAPLGACTWLANTFGDNPTQEAKTTIVEVFTDACGTYAVALKGAAAALQANLLTDSQIAAIDKAKAVGDGICKGPQPTNVTSAVVSVLGAASTIVLNSGGN